MTRPAVAGGGSINNEGVFTAGHDEGSFVITAAQYAERLLSTKTNLPQSPAEIAKTLVYHYKDHGFVIDIEEARKHLGAEWIHTEGEELALAEKIYKLFNMVNMFLKVIRQQYCTVVGSIERPTVIIYNNEQR